jgi:hypothetical protein
MQSPPLVRPIAAPFDAIIASHWRRFDGQPAPVYPDQRTSSDRPACRKGATGDSCTAANDASIRSPHRSQQQRWLRPNYLCSLLLTNRHNRGLRSQCCDGVSSASGHETICPLDEAIFPTYAGMLKPTPDNNDPVKITGSENTPNLQTPQIGGRQ